MAPSVRAVINKASRGKNCHLGRAAIYKYSGRCYRLEYLEICRRLQLIADHSYSSVIARLDLSQYSESQNHARPSPFVQRAPKSLNALLGWKVDLDEALSYAYPCPKKRAEGTAATASAEGDRARIRIRSERRVLAHCLTLNLGNGMSVSEAEAKRRLNYVRVQLLKAVFGNSWRRKGAAINFFLFEQGSRERGNQHFHVLMRIKGEHNWSDFRIAMKIQSIELWRKRKPWEKPAHVDWDWKKGNAFMAYVSRETAGGADRYDIF